MKNTYRYIQQMEFLCCTQPLSPLPRDGLMAELMGLWPHPPKRYGFLASPVITETSIMACSQRPSWRCITWGELKEFSVDLGGGSLSVPSSEIVQLLLWLAPATSPSLGLGEVLLLPINIWELLPLYGARHLTGEKFQFCSCFSALYQGRPVWKH